MALNAYQCEACGEKRFGEPDVLILRGTPGGDVDGTEKQFSLCKDNYQCQQAAHASWYYRNPMLLRYERRRLAAAARGVEEFETKAATE